MRIIIAAIFAAGSIPCLLLPLAVLLIFVRERRPKVRLGAMDLAILWLVWTIFWALIIPEGMFSY